MIEARARRNPYIVGTVIKEVDKFFGREGLFQVIEDNLRQNVQLILLYGQRRIGKSSVLKQIPQKIAREEFIFVNFDTQDKEQLLGYEIFYRIAIAIVEALELHDQVTPPSARELATNIEIFSREFLPQVYQQIGDKNLVLLLDEFDVLSESNPGSDKTEFFNSIKLLLKQHQRLFIIPVVGRHLNELKNLRTFFKSAPYKEIALLDEDSAQRLITKPAQGVLVYESEAIQAILKLSAGHPFFTQVICFTLFAKARERDQWTITRADVEGIVDKVFQEETAQAGLAWFWDGLLTPEQVVLSAVAEAQKIAIEHNQRVPEEPLTLLSRYGVIPTEVLIAAAKQLADNGFLDDTGRRVKVELVRRWLVQSHPLKRELWELEKLEQDNVNSLLSIANNLHQQGNPNALQLYEQALVLNPNHFRAIKSLAQAYLQVEDFDKALELYKQAHKFSPAHSQEELLQSRETYGHKLITQREFGAAKIQFQEVLQIDPHRLLATQKLAEIAAYESGIANFSHPPTIVTPVINPPANRLRRKQILQASITAAILAAITIPIGFGVYQVSAPCPPGQQKDSGLFCRIDTSSISHGDRTLFPQIINSDRDLGIAAFKKGNYQDAKQFFGKAVAANRNDPEVLIYYNNASARLKGSYVTLAAVVPTQNKTEFAQEILRGVAQAQNQFNNQSGYSGQLLEIVIANDGNEPDKAKQVADNLIQDPSVLGIIGHDDSNATIAALPKYEQAQLAIVSPTSSSILIKSPVFFRTVSSDETAGQKLAEYASKTLGLKKVVIFANPDSKYSNSMREVFTNHFQILKGEVVNAPLIDLTSPTFSAENEVPKSLYRFKAEAALLFPDTKYTNVAIKIVKANENLKNRTQNTKRRGLKLLGGETLYNQETLIAGGSAVEGLIIETPWFREAPEAKDFAQKAERQWGGSISWRTATSFDATQAFIKSLFPHPSRTTILERLRTVKISKNETSGYPLQFTTEGERQTTSNLVKVEGGKFVKVE